MSPSDVSYLISPYIEETEYDYIFVVIKFADEMMKSSIEKDYTDWIGLGGMDYLDIGFSNIRLPGDGNTNIYKFNLFTNAFPEEVYLHEYLHTLERLAEEYGYERPELHNYEKYGYENDKIVGQKSWYIDYMAKNIKTGDNKLIGLDKEVYKYKPVHPSNFSYSMELKFDESPENIIEEIRGIFKVFSKVQTNITKQGAVK